VHEGTPRSWAGVASGDGRNVGGRVIQGDEGPLVSGERPVLTTGAVPWGRGIRFLHAVAPAVKAWS